jgi:hypothetical protein
VKVSTAIIFSLPGGADIFDQTGGQVFEIPPTPYEIDGQDVTYFEGSPPAGPDSDGTYNWEPKSYFGVVSIISDNEAELDLTFTDDIESRRIQAIFFFDSVEGESQNPSCDV